MSKKALPENQGPGSGFFGPGPEALSALSIADPRMAFCIESLGAIVRQAQPELFSAMAKAIIGQQISTKAQESIFARAQTLFNPFCAESLSKLAPEEIRLCGISLRKAEYIRELALLCASGELEYSSLDSLSDEALCQRLSALRGVGRWTAEMLLIFCFGREDVLSTGDLGIQRGARMLYEKRELSPTFFKRLRKLYSPYASYASLYLWAVAGGALAGLKDPGANSACRKRGPGGGQTRGNAPAKHSG